jgi:hypothetical protein
MDGDEVPVLHPQIVSYHTVDAGAPIVEVIIGQDNENRIPTFLALDQDGVASEQLQGFHGVIGQCNNGTVIIGGIGHPV